MENIYPVIDKRDIVLTSSSHYQIGIEDTLYTLRLFADELAIEKSRIFVACGYANRIGEAGKNQNLVDDVRKLGRQMAASLKD